MICSAVGRLRGFASFEIIWDLGFMGRSEHMVPRQSLYYRSMERRGVKSALGGQGSGWF